MIVPPVGLVVGTVLLWGYALSWVDLVLSDRVLRPVRARHHGRLAPVLLAQELRDTRRLRGTFAILGSMAMQGPLTQWVTDHRKHHALSDQPGDPHSPHAGPAKAAGQRARGLCALARRLAVRDEGPRARRQYGKDLYEDTLIRWIDRLYLLWVALASGSRSWSATRRRDTGRQGCRRSSGAASIRIFLFQHVTFSINSICHMYGKRSFRTRDESRNVWLVAMPSFGESWHNGHHAFPGSAGTASTGCSSTSPAAIRGLERLGLAWDVKRPDVESARAAWARLVRAAYLGVETAGTFGGRKLTDDVIDTSLGVIFGGTVPAVTGVADDGNEDNTLTKDNVDQNTAPKHFLDGSMGGAPTFPILGAPH